MVIRVCARALYVGRSCCTSLWAWACLLSLVHSLCQLFYCGWFVGDVFRFEEVLHSLGRTVLTALFSSLKLDASSSLWVAGLEKALSGIAHEQED